MSVSNGQDASATTFNNAFASKSGDNTLAGVQTLSNGGSGSTVTNVQQQINDNLNNIATNTSNVSTNTTDIATNTADIAALDGYGVEGSLSIADSQSNQDIIGMSVDGDVIKSALYYVIIERSTTIFTTVMVACHFKNGTWVVQRMISSDDVDGITFSVNQTGNVGQLRYSSDASGTGELKFKRMSFNV